MEKWWLMQFRVCETHISNGKTAKAVFPQQMRLIQAQTEAEAIAKFKLFGLEPNQEYISHKNLTII